MIEVLCGLKRVILLFRACSVKLFRDKYIRIMCTISIGANLYSHVKKINSFSCQESGDDVYMQETSDLSIAQWLILSCTQPNINCLWKSCPQMGPLEALICVIITLNLSIIIHNK